MLYLYHQKERRQDNMKVYYGTKENDYIEQHLTKDEMMMLFNSKINQDIKRIADSMKKGSDN